MALASRDMRGDGEEGKGKEGKEGRRRGEGGERTGRRKRRRRGRREDASDHVRLRERPKKVDVCVDIYPCLYILLYGYHRKFYVYIKKENSHNRKRK